MRVSFVAYVINFHCLNPPGPAMTTTSSTPVETANTVVFLIDNLPDSTTLAASLPTDATVVLLDADGDALTQMADYLAGLAAGSVTAIHLVSHGSSGSLSLGNLILDNDNLSNYATELAQIGTALSDDGDLLLYGCNVAAGEEGHAFIAALAEATGADVAASDDLTGAADKGGDWILETSVGADLIQAAPLSSAIYDELLAIVSFDNTDLNSGSGTYNKTVSSVGFTFSG